MSKFYLMPTDEMALSSKLRKDVATLLGIDPTALLVQLGENDGKITVKLVRHEPVAEFTLQHVSGPLVTSVETEVEPPYRGKRLSYALQEAKSFLMMKYFHAKWLVATVNLNNEPEQKVLYKSGWKMWAQDSVVSMWIKFF